MASHEPLVPDDELPERQRSFLQKLRSHDKRVKIVRDGDKLIFHGPVIGEGPMPAEGPPGFGGDDEP
jgi:hypothetical protein